MTNSCYRPTTQQAYSIIVLFFSRNRSSTNNRRSVSDIAAIILSCILFSFLSINIAVAWDAGNPDADSPKYSKTQCIDSECSGGVIKPTLAFSGTIAGWFSMSRVADCPSGYTNNGLTCGRGADSISAPSRLADCPSGYSNIGPAGCGMGASTYNNPSSVANCPSGYTNMGLDCQKGANIFDRKGASSMTCPAGSKKHGARCYPNCRPGYTNNGEFCGRGASTKGPSAFTCPSGYFQGITKDRCHKNCPSDYTNIGEACVRGVSTLGLSSQSCKSNEWFDSGRCIPIPNIKMRGNTHLWVVNRALDLLNKSSDPVARQTVSTMRSQACSKKWHLGLYDGDEPNLADNPTQKSKPTAGTHFYNPTGKDAYGKSTTSVTYLMAGIDVSTGGLSGRKNLTARQSALNELNKIPVTGPTAATGCYELGLALHYMTDMTQPMHTSSYSGINSPMFLHPNFEAYVPAIQTRFPANSSWDGQSKNLSPDMTFEAVARRSNALAPALISALTADGKQCTIDGLDLSPIPYVGFCFVNDAAVDTQIGIVLNDAYQSTASYLYTVFKQYTVSKTTANLVPTAPTLVQTTGSTTQPAAKGLTVKKVTFKGGASFVNVSPGVWHELRQDGSRAFTFKENNRDEWSVYLRDDSRGVNIQLDLWKKDIVYSDDKGSSFVLAKVESASVNF